MCSKIKCVLIDLSGTIHIENTVISGAIEALQRLKSSPLKYRFVTNTTKESQNFLHNRLTTIGFDIRKDEIFTSLTAAKNTVLNMKLKPLLLLEDEALEDFDNVPNVSVNNPNDGDSVVIGLAPSKFNYETLNVAFRMLLNGAKLIAIHKSRYFKQNDGLCLGPGPFVAALEYAADVKPIIVGKPQKSFFLSALETLQCQPHETVMIGDDVRVDIEGSQESGMTGILVKTGKYRSGDESKISPPPKHVFPSFVEAIDYILNNMI